MPRLSRIDFGRTESGVDLALAENQERLATDQNAEWAQSAEEEAIRQALQLSRQRVSTGYSRYSDALDVEGKLDQAATEGPLIGSDQWSLV